jgi:hypothetical protein
MVLLNMLMQTKSLFVTARRRRKLVSFEDDVKDIQLIKIPENKPEYLYQPETYRS